MIIKTQWWKMVSMQDKTQDPFRLYGMNHFAMKYGIPLDSKSEKPKRLFPVDIVENEIQDNIVTWIKTDYGEIPLFEELKGDSYIEQTENSVNINFDVFNEVGHILSGHLEKLSPEEKTKIAKIPIVDIYEKILFDALPGKIKTKPFWPDGKKFAVCLTHDVDEIRKTYQYFTRPLIHLKRGEFSKATEHIKSFFTDRVSDNKPYWTFDKIMDIEEELEVKSTFFFLQEDAKVEPSKPETWKHYARRYKFNNLEVIKIIHKLSSGGWEVGLHGSYYSYLHQDKLQKEKKDLENVCNESIQGIRQHHLNLKIPETWHYQEKIGLGYDTSLGFKDNIGFRWGTCFPFYPLDAGTGKPLSILELPLIIMDTPLFTSKENVWGKIPELVETVEKQNGLLTILFHHSVFNESEYPGWTKMYRRIINLCKEKNAWITNANEIVKWWASRENGNNN